MPEPNSYPFPLINAGFQIRIQEEMRLSKNSSSRGGYGISSPLKRNTDRKGQKGDRFSPKVESGTFVNDGHRGAHPKSTKEQRNVGGKEASGEQLVPY